jgi:hypothetical protein
MAGGSLNGLDLVRIADTLIDPLAPPVTGGSGTTVFSNLAADFAVADGEVRTDGLVIQGKAFRATLAGHGSFFTGAIDARARLTTAPGTIPLAVSGSWHAPVVGRVPEAEPVPEPVPARP